ncbi:MAG: ISLre2 family transposase [Deltaproteobacteria bacterium]|jgi:hypothetical protein|nr:ISLre2 family transposase [Deltaproteobacteria bacterium]
MEKITEKHPDFKSFEKELFELMCRIACGLIQQYLEWRDLGIMALRDRTRYRNIDIRASAIKTVFGEVSYSRRYYYDKESNERVFLLDRAMGIGCEFGLVSENLAEQIVHECADKSYRRAAGSVSRLTGQGISAMGAWNVVQRYGRAIEEQEARLSELDGSGSVGHLGGVPSKVLFEEYDDVWISRQRERRRKPGAAAAGAAKIGKKPGKLPMHAGIAYTGWTQAKDGRCSTADKIAYASFSSTPAFRAKFETLLNHRFDMDGVERRITNGDGDPWIRSTAEGNDAILQLDPFHRSQAIVRAVGDKSDRELLFGAIREKDVGKVLASICEMAMDAQDESAQKKLAKLYGYFYSNRDSFLTWHERGIDLPAPPEGVSYRNLGIQESSNCLITQRMKHRRGSWSEGGANNMARILCFRGTIGLDAILGALPEPEPTEALAEPLSAAKAPQRDGKGYGADWLHAPMPFEGAFKTLGREAIRAMLRMKPLSRPSFL